MSKINKELIYTVKEVNEILGIHPRKLHRVGKKEGIKKTDNRYLFKGEFLIEYFNLTTFDNVEGMSNNVGENVEASAEEKGMKLKIGNLNDKLRQEQEENNYLRNEMLKLRQQMERLIASNNNVSDNTTPMSNNVETQKTKTSADWYKSVHPPNTTEKTKDGKEIPKPSMNDINFESSYNPNWNVDNGDWEVQKWED